MSSIAYRLFGDLSRRWEKELSTFKELYDSAGLAEPFYVYLSKVLAALFFGAPIVFALSLLLHLRVLEMTLVRGALASVLLTAIYVVITLGLGLYLSLIHI